MAWLNALLERAKALFSSARQNAPLLDHLAQAGGRYRKDGGDRLAASLTYYPISLRMKFPRIPISSTQTYLEFDGR